MKDDVYCLWFCTLKGIKLEKFIMLYSHFGSYKAIYECDKSELSKLVYIGDAEIKALSNKNTDLADKILSDCEKYDIRFISYFDEKYPKMLKDIANPPKILYVKGSEVDFNNIVTVAIVGSRRPSNYGDKMSFKFGFDLAKEGVTIVSGMARGVDGNAQRGALKGGGKTIAVLGCGCDIIYPPEHKDLMNVIFANGCVVSEYPPETPPLRCNFPERNRIMSGLSMGVVIIEGETNSGTGITAKLCSDQGKELYCLPGNVDNPLSYVPNAYIKDGCPAVTEAKDVIVGLTALYPELMLEAVLNDETVEAEKKKYAALTPRQQQIIAVLSNSEPIHIDDICYKCELYAAEVSQELLLLELSGVVVSMPGRNYMLK